MTFNMDESMSFHKILHLVIDQFILEFKKYIEQKEVDENKVYLEIVKRSSSISHRIRYLTCNFLNSYKITDVPASKGEFQDKIHDLVESSLQQDLLECALNSEEVALHTSLSEDVLHNILFICSVDDSATITPSLMKQLVVHPQWNQVFSLPSFDDGVSLQLSNQFENAKSLFENEISQLRSSLQVGVSIPDPKSSDTPKEDVKMLSAAEGKLLNVQDSQSSTERVEDWLQLAMEKSHHEPPSWESGMKQSIACHLYTTELSGREVGFNLIEEDPQVFRSLHNLSGVLSEVVWVRDILDMLVGIPSYTFLFEEASRQFQMRSHMCLSQLSHESTFKLSEKFIELGTLYQRLKRFCVEIIHPEEGLVMKGLKSGVHEILSMYTEYIIGVKADKPSMHLLRTQVLENAQLLNTLGDICSIYITNNVLPDVPKGLNLLCHLNRASWSHKKKGNAIIMAVVLKYAYAPYLSFLNKWISEGVCFDPYDEFHIIEDVKYFDRKDELYWKFAYTDNEDDATRIIPPEIAQFAGDILQCGKSMRLLQNCCPTLFYLEYIFYNPPPTLSMVFSYDATHKKRESCDSYILQMELFEEQHKKKNPVVSEDAFYVEQQRLVDRRGMLQQVKKRWNQTHLSNPTSDLKEENGMEEHNLRRSNSFPNITIRQDSGCFSGILHRTNGLLFGTCVQQDHRNVKNSFYASKHSWNHTTKADKFVKENFSSPNHLKRTCKGKTVNSSVTNSSLESSSGSFMDDLISLLQSEFGDSKEDIYSFIQITSLQSLLQYNFNSVLSMRMHLIQKAIMDYMMHQLKLQDLLSSLKNTYFLQDECFNQSLCTKLFKWVMKCSTLDDFADWSRLNEILTRSVNVPSFVDDTFLESASANFVALPEECVYKRHEFLQFFHFEFKIEWPLNIIISKACITQYSSIFSFLLEIEFLCWLLGQVWRTLINHAKNKHIENSPWYRKVMLNRFDMHQFLRVLRNCIHQDIGGPLWESLLRSLSTQQLSMDALEETHRQYLEKALLRCFLTANMHNMHDLLKLLFVHVYNFCDSVLKCCWENEGDSRDWSDYYDSYKKCKDHFYNWLSKMTTKRLFKSSWDEHYQLYLETILETRRSI